MSAVTLETLRADFEAARLAHAQRMAHHSPKWAALILVRHVDEIVEGLGDCLGEVMRQSNPELSLKANMLDLAEKHDLDAAMLFKLSGGNIDPRVSA